MTEKKKYPKEEDSVPEFSGKDTAELVERLYPEIKEKKKPRLNTYTPW